MRDVHRAREHARGELRIHQHDVHPGRLEPADPLPDRPRRRPRRPRPEHGVAPGLPDDELRPVDSTSRSKRPSICGSLLAADALVDHGHGEARPAAAQLLGEHGPDRLCAGSEAPTPCGRGGADGDDDQRLPAGGWRRAVLGRATLNRVSSSGAEHRSPSSAAPAGGAATSRSAIAERTASRRALIAGRPGPWRSLVWAAAAGHEIGHRSADAIVEAGREPAALLALPALRSSTPLSAQWRMMP